MKGICICKIITVLERITQMLQENLCKYHFLET